MKFLKISFFYLAFNKLIKRYIKNICKFAKH